MIEVTKISWAGLDTYKHKLPSRYDHRTYTYTKRECLASAIEVKKGFPLCKCVSVSVYMCLSVCVSLSPSVCVCVCVCVCV